MMKFREVIINDHAHKLIPYGYCHCGCGQKTNLMPQNDKCKGLIKGQPYRHLWGHQLKNAKKHMIGKKREKSPSWKGGRSINGGYVRIYLPEHPKADSVGYVREHVYLAEQALGKTLKFPHEVHHFNPHQLVICQDSAYHKLLHQRQRAYEVCGNAHWRKCQYCKQYDNPINMYVTRSRAYHRECRNEYLRNKHQNRQSL